MKEKGLGDFKFLLHVVQRHDSKYCLQVQIKPLEKRRRKRRRRELRREGKGEEEEEGGNTYSLSLSLLQSMYFNSDIFTNSLIPSCSRGGKAGVLHPLVLATVRDRTGLGDGWEDLSM